MTSSLAQTAFGRTSGANLPKGGTREAHRRFESFSGFAPRPFGSQKLEVSLHTCPAVHAFLFIGLCFAARVALHRGTPNSEPLFSGGAYVAAREWCSDCIGTSDPCPGSDDVPNKPPQLLVRVRTRLGRCRFPVLHS